MTESLIMDAMERLMRGRTTLMIAHRLSTLEHCDVRLHMENGRVHAVGPSERIPPPPTARVGAVSPERTAGE